MKSFHYRALACLGAALLASCGGGADPAAPGAPMAPASATMSGQRASVGHSATDYYPMIQRLYVAYFGRPADPAGQAYFAGLYLGVGAATDVFMVSQTYNSNAGIKSLIDDFSASAESQALYPGDNTTFITAIYHNLFNRDPEPAGMAYWADLINRGIMTRANAAVSILAGSQGGDLDLINKKVQAADAFTASLNTATKQASYDGDTANASVRAMLATVTVTTDITAFQSTIDSTIAALVTAHVPSFAQVQTIITARCVGCHSAHPTIAGFSPAPLGITFDTEAQIRADASRIYENAVATSFMPYGNRTNMTDAERATVGAWFNGGQP